MWVSKLKGDRKGSDENVIVALPLSVVPSKLLIMGKGDSYKNCHERLAAVKGDAEIVISM